MGHSTFFRKSLGLIAAKITVRSARDKIKKALSWHFEQSEVKDLMDVIQRQKTCYLLALQGNHLSVPRP